MLLEIFSFPKLLEASRYLFTWAISLNRHMCNSYVIRSFTLWLII